MATVFNFVGAFAGTAVAKTIGAGLVDEQTTSQAVVAASLLGAIAWNLLTWWFGLPSSSSHALIGGLVGATLVASGANSIHLEALLTKVLLPLIAAPVIGFATAFVLMAILLWIFRRAHRRPMSAGFRRLQVFSGAYMSFAHGSNDAQKTMGIITLALFTAGFIPSVEVPAWVIVLAASAISLGTAVGGWRIIGTMGHRVAQLEPVHGFAAQTTAATVLVATAHFGMPVSTTQVMSTAIMGVGASQGVKRVRWGVARRIVGAWALTLPAAGIVGAVTWLALHALGLG
jgi:inorganic phosphate transporter, PiT family